MEFVEPIKDLNKIEEIKVILKERSHRDYTFFVFGINTGLLVSHLLKIKVSDVFDGQNVNDFFILKELKNAENKYFYLNNKVKKALIEYIQEERLEGDDFLFISKKNNQPITRQQAYRIVNNIAREVGITEKIGTHTLRKTFGYHSYRKGIAISLLQSIFNHATRTETLKYIGIKKDDITKVKIDVNL